MNNNTLDINKTSLWKATYDAQKQYRFICHQGGSSSGKTFAILDVLLFLMCTEKNLSITVTTNNYPHLRRGPLKDLKSIWSSDPLYQKMISVPNQNGCKCDVTGSFLEFACFPTVESAKGPKRSVLYVDEATSIPYEIAFELIARTKKTIYFSWNPSSRFWVNDKYEGHPQAKWIYSTHRANQFLPQSIHDELESLKDKDPYRYRVYCLGMTGQVDGLVYTNWQQINELPPLEECKWRAFGLDYGFTCFTGDMLVTTDRGQVPIREVTTNDRVLTTRGYKRVLAILNNGFQEVVEKEFSLCDYISKVKIKATKTHLIKTRASWKQFQELTKKDMLCTISSLTGSDSLRTLTQSVSTLSGLLKKTESLMLKDCTERCGNFTKVRYLKDMIFITLMKTLTTTKYQTCNACQNLNTLRFMLQDSLKKLNIFWRIISTDIQKRIGMNDVQRLKKLYEVLNLLALDADVSLRLQTRIKNGAARLAKINTKIACHSILKSVFVSGVEKLICIVDTFLQELAQMSVPTSYKQIHAVKTISHSKEEVFDLTIEECHEYFINGILVHNCDPTALVEVRYAHGELFLKEHIYKTGMTNMDIADTIKALGFQNELIIADSAEMKSIEEMRRLGIINIKPAIKGKGSIMQGISLVQSMKLNVTMDSINLKTELMNYMWETDALGHSINKPIDKWNHTLDSIRYLVSYKMERPKTKSKLSHF